MNIPRKRRYPMRPYAADNVYDVRVSAHLDPAAMGRRVVDALRKLSRAKYQRANYMLAICPRIQ